MRRATLLFNPAAGSGGLRGATLRDVTEALRSHGIEPEVVATEGPGTAGRLAREASARGADIVFACGGDGTVHEALQGLVHQQPTALGVLPMGSANVLARHLRLPLDAVGAAVAQTTYQPRSVPVGHITFRSGDTERSRYFLTVAGAGPDGALVYRMVAGGKQRLGRWMYYLRAARLFAGRRFTSFEAEYELPSGATGTRSVTSAMCVRVGDLGGLFSPLLRGADLAHEDLMISLVKSPAEIALPAWFAMSWARLHRWNPMVETVHVQRLLCTHMSGRGIEVQADGEYLGRTPMELTLVPDALQLLCPPQV